jgi:uncharacterized protein (TIGR01777 family)
MSDAEAPMRIAIGGASGMIGTALRRELEGAGHTVVALVRRPASDGEIRWDPAASELEADAIAGFDAVVNLAGVGIGFFHWTQSYRDEFRSSRVDTTSLLATTYAQLGGDAPPVLVNASAIDYYGDRGDELLTEESGSGAGFLADVCREWEAAADPARAHARVVHVRTGRVLAKGGGALGKMEPIFKVGLGGRFGSGRQWVSWISLRDEVRAIIHALTSDLDGPVNLTSPNPVTNRELTETLGSVLHRPTLIPVPAFAPKLLLGPDMAGPLLFDSKRVVPAKLLGDDFAFEHADLADGLRAALGIDP